MTQARAKRSRLAPALAPGRFDPAVQRDGALQRDDRWRVTRSPLCQGAWSATTNQVVAIDAQGTHRPEITARIQQFGDPTSPFPREPSDVNN